MIANISMQAKPKGTKEVYANQNYLNFIKKNHQLIKQEINMHSLSKDINPQKYQTQNSCIFDRKPSKQYQSDSYSKINNVQRRVIHDSLSKFEQKSDHQDNASHFHNSLSKIINSNNQEQKYNNILKKNDDIVSKLISKNMRNKQQQQVAKELLFHLNKNKNPNSKKVLTKISLDRYQTLQEPQIQMNLKFPIIQRKSHATIEPTKPNKQKINLLQQLRQKGRIIHIKQKPAQILIFQRDKSLKIYEQTPTLEQMYRLFPSFKLSSKSRTQDERKRSLFVKNGSSKKKLGPTSSIEEQIDKYLQDNMIMKSILMSKRQSKYKEIFNKQILDKTDLQIQLEQAQTVLQNGLRQCQSQFEAIESSDTRQIRSQIRHKTKKEPLELKYNDGDLSVYDIKMRHYRQFLFMINLCHRIYDPLILKENNSFKPQNRYKYHMGKGNNYLLVKSLIKRRYWWTLQDDPKKANFLWTQLKVNSFYELQNKSDVVQRYHKTNEIVDKNDKPQKRKKKIKLQIESKNKGGGYKAPLPDHDNKIFTEYDKKHYDQFLKKAENPEKLLKFSNRLKYFEQNFFKTRPEDLSQQKLHNHLEFNYFIGNKKALFYNLKQYYQLLNKNVFDYIPLTFHIKEGAKDPTYQHFVAEFKKLQKEKLKNKTTKNVWIVKPGELSNRGQGITVIDQIYELNNILKKKLKHSNGIQKTYIVQKYLEKPLLYKLRKFDIRHYMVISKLHGTMRAYWFGQGYIRTSSKQFDLTEVGDPMIHLTNDAIQKHSSGYGKYEEGNKISYSQFQRYMDATVGQGKFSFSEMIYPKMKSIASDAVKSTYLMLDTKDKEHNFQVFGLDFMIDSNYNVWLIEVNTNPCLELSSKLLARIIPTMVQQTLRLTLDVIFPPPAHYPNSQKYLAPDNPLQRLQFQLIFDQDRDGKQIKDLYENANIIDMGQVDQQDETYENDGKEIQLQNQIE